MLVDLLHLLRNLRRAPASAIAAVLTLSLTLGAGASIFAVVDAALLTPPPFANPGELFAVGEIPIDDPAATPRAVGYGTFEAWRERTATLAALEAFDGTNLTLTGRGTPERISAANVTPGFLTLLGAMPMLGRSFDSGDVGQPVAIVSHAFWRSKLDAEPGAIGRTLVLGGRAHTIVGILPERFFFALSTCDVWRPFPVTPAAAVRQGYRVRAIARVEPPLGASAVAGALDDVSRASLPPARVVATPVATAIAGGAAGMLGVLGGAVALATLIAFTNLAGLLLVRTIDRRRELAVRSALGATRAEIARQLLLESGALVAIGTAGGVLLALWTTPVVGRLALEQFGDIANREVAVSWRVIGAVSVSAAACALLCGWLPAVIAARGPVGDVLRAGATPPPRERTLRRLFVSGEVALAFVLLVAMTLVGRSLFNVLRVNPGFDARGLLTMHLALPAAGYDSERVASFYSTLQAALEQRLGARAIAIVDEIPLTGDRGRSLVSEQPTAIGREAVVRAASPGYFETMRIPLAAGRAFERGDNASAPPRVVVSESLAARLFPREQAIGRHLSLASTSQTVEIVGVVGDVKHRALDDDVVPTVYLSAMQAPSHSSIVVVRSARPDADAIATVREEVARLDPNLPVYTIRPMDDIVAASPGVPARRVLTAAFTGFAALAVVLGALGLFGVTAHDVASRRAELALRIALGADPARILAATLGQGAVMVGAGLLVGAGLSIWTSRALGIIVLATSPLDLASVAAPAVILIVAGACAILPVARRAARTDPLITLRAE